MNTPETQSGGSLKPVGSETQWQYLMIDEDLGGEPIKELDKLGSDGWQMCGIASGMIGSRMYFKRPLPNAADQRPRATEARLGTETLSRGSLHPHC
jgi:hypothetical protein